ncbi:hypothetical protein MNV49_000289 [Pseudohyphozyma bogoriensis]|nr:hypothetical protein MNV49_000289 [Pseudohyphozyma bogoriensis]
MSPTAAEAEGSRSPASLSTTTLAPALDAAPEGVKEKGEHAAPTTPTMEASAVVAPPVPYSVFTNRQKWMMVGLVSTAGLLSPLSANIYFPAIQTIADDLHVPLENISLTLTILSPTFWSSIGDVLGRRPTYIGTYAVSVAACVGLSFTNTYWLLMVLRFFQAAGSASVLSLGSGTIGDISPPAERGGMMGIFSLGPYLGPAIGPVIGGLILQYLKWQYIFVFLSIYSGIVLILIVVFLPETLRAIVGNGSIPAQGVNRTVLSIFRTRNRPPPEDTMTTPALPRKTWKDVNPVSSLKLFREKDAIMVLTFNAFNYTFFYCVNTSASAVLKRTYGLSSVKLGLCFLAFGGGCVTAALLNTRRLDADYQHVKRKLIRQRLADGGVPEEEKEDVNDLSGFPIEEARLRSAPMYLAVLLIPAIVYGWAVDKKVNLALPLVCTFFVGIGSTTLSNSCSTLMVDLFPGRGASSIACMNLTRCFLGAAGTAVVNPIIDRIGNGPAICLLAGINCLVIPVWYFEIKLGPKIRAERAERMERDKREKEQRRKEKGSK